MKKTLLAMVSVATVGLAGCGAPEAVWVHDSKDNQGFMTDRDFCNRRIDPNQAGFKERFEGCMTQFGWRQESK
ncbi:hypothetical protein [Ferrimonas pelagia]|uniref:Entry exclusion lipoprotein TrbK n=1 Tax=Ferrimonas pelagia TaxID=1177826 RepID=A0ABP9EJI1_9GAMM